VWSLLEGLRRRRFPPEARLAEVGVSKGMKVADIGAGYGFFAFPAAEMVGDEGVVYAVEPNAPRAAEISKRAAERGVKNLKVLEAGAEDIAGIPAAEVDIAMSVSSFHHFTDTKRSLIELGRIVRPGGLIYIRDIKAGRIIRHGSRGEGFRKAVSREFPNAKFEEGSGHLLARVRIE